MRTLNLGILAHVDAGKTTLTERLLYNAGAIDHIGSVDAGTTQTDSLDLERERGITIKSAVASFVIDDLAVNLVDTPGHPDFIAEVERVLGVLDGAVLVVSAVEGVQPQTPLLFRALRRLGVPTLIFVNKIDRPGADEARVLAELSRRLSPALVPMGATVDAGTRGARFAPADLAEPARRSRLAETLAERDEALLGEFVRDELALTTDRLRYMLAEQTRKAQIHPVYFGSAMSGAGVDALTGGIAEFLRPAGGDPDAEPSGRVFKIERTPSGERVAYVRMFDGSLRPRRRVRVGATVGAGAGNTEADGHGEIESDASPGGDAADRRASRRTTARAEVEAKPTSVSVFAPTGAPRRSVATPGDMAKVAGLGAVRVGDAIGEPPANAADEAEHHFPLPTLEAAIVARRPDQQGSMRAALAQLAEQDPLINVRQDDSRHEISVSLYGEVQREVILETLRRDYGIEADFRETTTLCIERPAGIGQADEVIRAKTHTNITGRSSPFSENPFPATMGLRIEPLAAGAGIEFRLDVDVRLIPLYLFRTVDVMVEQMEAYVREALAEGLSGWGVTDCRVTMWDCGYTSPITSPADFRKLTQLVLATALDRAGTWVCEPLARLSLELPQESTQGALAALGRLGGRVRGQFSSNDVSFVDAVLPVARVRDLQHQLPGLTGGEGLLETRFGGHQPVGGTPPRRPRSSPSPLDRDEWLAWLNRRG